MAIFGRSRGEGVVVSFELHVETGNFCRLGCTFHLRYIETASMSSVLRLRGYSSPLLPPPSFFIYHNLLFVDIS